jgi:hypothetical protein
VPRVWRHELPTVDGGAIVIDESWDDLYEGEPPMEMQRMTCCGEWVDDPFLHECLGGGE